MMDETSDKLTNPPRTRVLSGMRPTGRLHLGNYMGALYNWVQLQHKYECYFFIADYHALTTDYADPRRLQENTLDVALDFLSAGLNPELCTVFVQSHVPQHAELNLLFSMITPLSWLERVPSYKDQQEQLREKDLATFGFLGYPLLQSADILLYQPDFVPVGMDQVAHVELTREVARRFNHFYPRTVSVAAGSLQLDSKTPPILPEPQVLLTPTPKLPGLDGRKMSKSYGNTIMLTDQSPLVRAKMEAMSNGGQRFTQDVPGDPDVCPVGDMHRLFSSPQKRSYIEQSCRAASIGCLQCKNLASDSISKQLEPIQERRFELEEDLEKVREILKVGAERAKERAEATMIDVRNAMSLSANRAEIHVKHTMDRIFQSLDNPIVHDLSSHGSWWHLEQTARTHEVQNYWLTEIVPRSIVLRRDSPRVFITTKGKRVYVSTSREKEFEPNLWRFYVRPKSYEYLVPLCWNLSRVLIDFVIPQKVYVEGWSRLKRRSKEDIQFEIRRQGDIYSFQLDSSEPVEINEFQSKYEPLQ